MARRILVYSEEEMKILIAVQQYLIQYFSRIEGSVTGGIYIRPKPVKIRLDVIELNHLPVGNPEVRKICGGFLNINYQDTDFDKVDEYTKHIDDLVADSIIGDHHYESDRQQIGRISPYLWMGNNMYKLTNI